LIFSQAVDRPLRYLLSFRNHALNAGLINQVEDCLGISSGQRLAELNAVIRQDQAFQDFAPVFEVHVPQIVAVEVQEIESDEREVVLPPRYRGSQRMIVRKAWLR
jgi:hypothetical protein